MYTLQGFSTYFLILLCVILELSTTKDAHATSVFEAYDHYGPPAPQPQQTTLNVMEFGAVGDGKTDDSSAFESAWEAGCRNGSGSVTISAPSGKTFLVFPIQFGGPCQPYNITLEILGSIVAPPKTEWKSKTASSWLKFRGVEGLKVVGNGQGLVDGQGASWWGQGDDPRPTAMVFTDCRKVEIRGLKQINSPKFHLSITQSSNVSISSNHIIAPASSPNTDGIDLFSSTNVLIQNSTIQTGDDCIAIKGGTFNVTISEIACGPGHGISIGSLGQSGKYDQVEAIRVNNCTLNGTTNGVRIKTWQGGSGFARNIHFSNINFVAADRPVIIDQFYCPHKKCSNHTSGVKVSEVTYTGLVGTSSCKNATISFRCSNTVPCTNITLNGVDITSTDPRNSTTAICLNAYGTAQDTTSPVVDCLIK
ncbi:probable polygalacturonase At3g15720 [Sesamum indicum]|uniref:Probable polygalacturonase At3g15720 n=1 Tax=Sesamum indicum TaxID=4182 RepID=A0A8M8UVV9_SESIN|nr:probable polygalacturonase At3g15720 [Sesamum indicum]